MSVISHKHAAVIKAWADGATIEWRPSPTSTWKDIAYPAWYDSYEYRVKYAEPWAAERAAHAGGAMVQVRVQTDGKWLDCKHPNFLDPKDYVSVEYRVKPVPAPIDFVTARTVDAIAASAPAPELSKFKAGDRVWVFPGTDYGFEAVVKRVRPNVFRSSRFYVEFDKSYGSHFGAPLTQVVLFDENHNQKRAHAQGKQIQFLSRFGATKGAWKDVAYPVWTALDTYRVKPSEAELHIESVRQAALDGKEIQFKARTSGKWIKVHLDGVLPELIRDPVRWHVGAGHRIKPVPTVKDIKFFVADEMGAAPRAPMIEVTMKVTKEDGHFTKIEQSFTEVAV